MLTNTRGFIGLTIDDGRWTMDGPRFPSDNRWGLFSCRVFREMLCGAPKGLRGFGSSGTGNQRMNTRKGGTKIHSRDDKPSNPARRVLTMMLEEVAELVCMEMAQELLAGKVLQTRTAMVLELRR